MSLLGPLADLRSRPPHVRDARESGLAGDIDQGPLSAISRLIALQHIGQQIWSVRRNGLNSLVPGDYPP